jgi:ABC-type nitrate/sulfonate/bicarbonate transport system substrate-binding protein
MIVTQRAGLFEREGLDVEIRMMNGAPGVVQGIPTRLHNPECLGSLPG